MDRKFQMSEQTAFMMLTLLQPKPMFQTQKMTQSSPNTMSISPPNWKNKSTSSNSQIEPEISPTTPVQVPKG